MVPMNCSFSVMAICDSEGTSCGESLLCAVVISSQHQSIAEAFRHDLTGLFIR